MRMSVEHERLIRMIKESISLMCKSSLSYDLELNVEGLLGITLDKKDIFLVNINESFQTEMRRQQEEEPRPGAEAQKRPQRDIVEIKEEEYRLSSSAKRRRARRRSRDSQGTADSEDIDSPHSHSHSQHSHSQHSPSTHRPVSSQHIDASRDNTNTLSSGLSEDQVAVKEESEGLDFGSFVIKQEVGEVGETIDDDDDDDFCFTGESFEGQPPYSASMVLPGPSGGGGGQVCDSFVTQVSVLTCRVVFNTCLDYI